MQIDKNYLKYKHPAGKIMHNILFLIQFDTFNVFKYFCGAFHSMCNGEQSLLKL
jgi:hypothetical protein